jgi:hypothetical protein
MALVLEVKQLLLIKALAIGVISNGSGGEVLLAESIVDEVDNELNYLGYSEDDEEEDDNEEPYDTVNGDGSDLE